MDKERETEINLGLDMNDGIKDGTAARLTEEEKAIAKSQGRDPERKEENDSNAIGVANFRVLSNGR